MGDISEEELMLLMQSPELMGLGGGQQTQYAASDGAVGTPEDVYYFGVPQIMGMMQDPNPQIQGVGMQLADQMETMPDAGMVPATANQIQSMAYGGAVTVASTGNVGGSTANATLSTAQLASHSHSGSNNQNIISSNTGGNRAYIVNTGNTGSAGSGQGHSHNMSATFSGDATSVLQPYLTVIYIIKT